MTDLRNNLFYYAWKELSQDAFICWLCSYALEDIDNSDSELVRCAHKFVCEFVRKGIDKNIESDKVHLLKIDKQVDHIDVFLTVEYLGEIYRIIIEDKINAKEHDDQLNRYKNLLKNHEHLICIYFKTGFQSDYSEVIKAGYKIFNRYDLLRILNPCESDNDIIRSYLEYWNEFERISQSYKTLPLNKWPDWQAVNGFYDEMNSLLKGTGLWTGYGYVNNSSGGFWGLWYGADNYLLTLENDKKAGIYLQIQTKWNDGLSRYDYQICLKLSNKTEKKDDEDVLDLRSLVFRVQDEFGFSKPSKLRIGKTMTVGVFSEIDIASNYGEFKSKIIESIVPYKQLITRLNQELINK